MFISTSDVDPLARQSHKLAEVAASFGVPVYSVFYSKDHDPQVQIQYPFALDTDAGMLGFQDALVFASNISKHWIEPPVAGDDAYGWLELPRFSILVAH